MITQTVIQNYSQGTLNPTCDCASRLTRTIPAQRALPTVAAQALSATLQNFEGVAHTFGFDTNLPLGGLAGVTAAMTLHIRNHLNANVATYHSAACALCANPEVIYEVELHRTQQQQNLNLAQNLKPITLSLMAYCNGAAAASYGHVTAELWPVAGPAPQGTQPAGLQQQQPGPGRGPGPAGGGGGTAPRGGQSTGPRGAPGRPTQAAGFDISQYHTNEYYRFDRYSFDQIGGAMGIGTFDLELGPAASCVIVGEALKLLGAGRPAEALQRLATLPPVPALLVRGPTDAQLVRVNIYFTDKFFDQLLSDSFSGLAADEPEETTGSYQVLLASELTGLNPVEFRSSTMRAVRVYFDAHEEESLAQLNARLLAGPKIALGEYRWVVERRKLGACGYLADGQALTTGEEEEVKSGDTRMKEASTGDGSEQPSEGGEEDAEVDRAMADPAMGQGETVTKDVTQLPG